MTPHNSSIKHKVMSVIMLVTLTVTLMTGIAFMLYDLVTFRQTMVLNLGTQAQIIADNSTAAMISQNEKAAGTALNSLRVDPHIAAAAIYDSQGRIFAKYPAQISDTELPAKPAKASHHFGKSHLIFFQPIVQSGKPLGMLYLQSDLTALVQRLVLYSGIALLIMFGSAGIALWLSNTLQQRISNPIIALAATAQKISEQQDYSLRAQKLSDDELGLLTDSFNLMLERIQTGNSALRTSEAQFRLVTDRAKVSLAHLDFNCFYKFANQVYAERYGRKLDQIIGKHAAEVVGTALFQRALPYIKKVLAGEPVQFELESHDSKDQPRWSHGEYTPEKNFAGEVVGFVVAHTDITLRKRNETQLAKLVQQTDAQARLFDATLSSISDLAYTFDLEGNWIYANKALLQIWGKSLQEIIGKSSLELGYPPALAERLKQQVKEVVQTGKPVRGETYFTDANGNEDFHEYIFSPVLTADGVVTAVCGTTRLSTDRKRAEKELERARDEALAASRAKDDFLAALSHELRTPLNPVLLVASDAAENPDLPASLRANFEMIRRNVELEARLIDDLLDLTRITREKLPLDLQPTDVHAVLQNALETVRADMLQKRIVLVLDLRAEQNMVFGDAVRLQQIFWNVLKNAVKFTSETQKVSVETCVENERVLIKVTDTGIGMTSQELDRVFNAFAQGDHAADGHSHRFGGLGLGLSISKSLVELHSGSIQATSDGPGKGSTFTIKLRLLNEANRQEKTKYQQPLLMPDLARPVNGNRILLVEDHEPTRVALAQLLKNRNFIIVTAASVAEALALAAKSKIDLLISDIGLPDGDGYSLMKELHGIYGLNGIALTGYGMEEDIARSRLAGFVAHLTKPIHVRALESALARVTAPPKE